MSDIIKDAKQLAELKVPPLRAELTVHEDEDPRYVDDCLVQIIEKDDENSIWYEEEHGGYEHGKLHFAHVFAAAPELAQALAEETYEYQIQTRSQRMPTWLAITDDTLQKWYPEDKYNEIIREGRVFRGGAGFEMRVLRRRVSPPEVINE